MSRRLPLNLMWSLNPIELQGIVVRPSLPHSPPDPQALLCSRLPTSSPLRFFSSSSTPPKQNFFKCLIFPPFGFLFCKHPLTCLSIDFSSLSSHCPLPLPLLLLPLFHLRLPSALRLHLPSPSCSPLLLMQTDLFTYFKLVAQVICGR